MKRISLRNKYFKVCLLHIREYALDVGFKRDIVLKVIFIFSYPGAPKIEI